MQKKETQDPGRIMDTNEVCKLYKIDRITLYRWSREGLPRHEIWKGYKRFWRYYKSEINDWLNTQKTRHREAVSEAGKKTRKRIRDKYFVNYPLPDEVAQDEAKKKASG